MFERHLRQTVPRDWDILVLGVGVDEQPISPRKQTFWDIFMGLSNTVYIILMQNKTISMTRPIDLHILGEKCDFCFLKALLV